LKYHDPAKGGPHLPEVVYRGYDPAHGNKEISMMGEGGVYVATKRSIAAQWGRVVAWRMKTQPKLLDLRDRSDPHAREVVEGASQDHDPNDEFDDAAAEVYMLRSTESIPYLKAHGYDGFRYFREAFLIGKLSDWAEPHEGGAR
jgi:hypothetical protein